MTDKLTIKGINVEFQDGLIEELKQNFNVDAVKEVEAALKEEIKKEKENMSQVELACKEAGFHFNKKHLEDPTVPMWIIMAKGKKYYVDHVEANLPWTTKETPDNVKTKGAIKFKDCLVTIGEDNCAKLTVLTKADEARIRNAERGITRIITSASSKLHTVLENHGIKFGPIKRTSGGCGSTFFITDIYDSEEVPLLLVAMSPYARICMPNEAYYHWYDDNTTPVPDNGAEYYDDEDEDEEYV